MDISRLEAGILLNAVQQIFLGFRHFCLPESKKISET